MPQNAELMLQPFDVETFAEKFKYSQLSFQISLFCVARLR